MKVAAEKASPNEVKPALCKSKITLAGPRTGILLPIENR